MRCEILRELKIKNVLIYAVFHRYVFDHTFMPKCPVD